MSARLILLTAVAAAALAAPELDALQLVQAGRGSVSTTVRVGLVIPDWTLGVLGADAAPDAATAPHTVRVKDHTGAWRTLDAADLVTLVPARVPADWQSVRMETQVIGRTFVLPALTFDLQPASR